MARRSAARFTAGDSIETTRSLKQAHKVAREPPTRYEGPEGGPMRGNTMSGMPGAIKTDIRPDSDNLRGGKTINPKGPPGEGGRGGKETGQGRFIGERGKGSTVRKAEAGNATGTMGGRSAWMGGGHRGSMEQRLRGKAKTFGERKGRSNMY